ncbi:cyclic AMP-dependent transcription factor ATF-3-like [Ylistrum balloti]|uniref:cyclic AMP-dependent transcription factor ATF-3-like n=1 Tax=Ylistrum balloti TaxID=509963 RepID=UPI002905C191|nr:cyclic AMP-dependent transcription factor ATF-3-like [Ylistrum balloti]
MADSPIPDDDIEVLEEIDDENLVKAIEESRRNQSTMPLIKQELRYTIQYRRMSSGQKELVLEEKTKSEYKLTNDEVRKLHRRREQNRRSSIRCRRRRKEYGKDLEKTITELEVKYCDLQMEIKRLNLEKTRLKDLLKRHLKQSKCKLGANTQTTAQPSQTVVHNQVLTRPQVGLPNTQSSDRLNFVRKEMMKKCTPLKSNSRKLKLVSLLSVH